MCVHLFSLRQLLFIVALNFLFNAQIEAAAQAAESCKLTIQLIESDTEQSVAGLVRVTDLTTEKHIVLKELIKRELNWFAMPADSTIHVPRGRIRIEAMHGIETELKSTEIDLTGKTAAEVKIKLNRFIRTSKLGLRTGNTHVHLMKLTHAEAIRYLQIVPAADDVDLIFLSHLRRIPDERHYISNGIVENSLAGGELARLSQGRVLYRPGQEHRNNFGRGGEGYGHVMFLDIVKLIRPVSIGPGIMREGTDGIPIQRGIREAKSDGATVVWCHNTFGLEDLPNWMAGTLDAQNIFDGGTHGSYEDTYYRYLNIGLKVPFSTGTDWFIYDFSRVYVPLEGKLTSNAWLKQLAAGRTFITNGPVLQLKAGGHQVGDIIRLEKPADVTIQGSAMGRANFKAIELIHNGKVVKTWPVTLNGGHYKVEMEKMLTLNSPGWIALRIPLDAGTNEFGKRLYAHTSPIYFELDGARIFVRETAETMVAEMQESMNIIREKAVFAVDSEREAVLNVHREGIAILRKRLSEIE